MPFREGVSESLVIAWRALWRLTGLAHGQVDPRWYALVVLGVVLVVVMMLLPTRTFSIEEV